MAKGIKSDESGASCAARAGFPTPRWDAARPVHVCGAIKVMEGNGKEIIWQIKKIPCKVTSGSLCMRPRIIPVTHRELETQVLCFFLLNCILGSREDDAAMVRTEPLILR